MNSVTLKPGSWPPSPGLAPCATLISISSQAPRYSAVTPKRPLAICLMLLLALSPDRKSVVSGKSVSVRVDLGGRRIINKKKQQENTTCDNLIPSYTLGTQQPTHKEHRAKLPA